MAVNKPIEFNVIIIFAKRVDKDFSNFQPSDVETKLEKGTKTQKSNSQMRMSQTLEAKVLNHKLQPTSLTKADTKNTELFEMIVGVLTTCHPVLQTQPHVISFYGVTSRIRFMLLLYPQVSRN